jgi:hypothetical protein
MFARVVHARLSLERFGRFLGAFSVVERSALTRVWLLLLRAYLVCAVILVIYKVALLALHRA